MNNKWLANSLRCLNNSLKQEGEKMNKLLQMENLERHYETPAGVVKALDGVSFEIHEGVVASGWAVES